MTLAEFWRGLPRWAKFSIWISTVLGCFCLAAGLYGDARGYWASRSFGVNLFTSLTTALFGIPFAAIFITWFTTSLESRVAKHAAESAATMAAQSAWADLRASIAAHVEIIRPETLRDNVKLMSDGIASVKAIFDPVAARNVVALGQNRRQVEFDWGTGADGKGYAEDWAAILRETKEVMAVGFNAFNEATAGVVQYNSDWAALRGKWDFLRTTVKAARTSAGLDWMPEDAETQFAYRFTPDKSPVNQTMLMWSRALKAIKPIMDAALAAHNGASPFEVAKLLNLVEVRIFDPQKFARDADAAATALESLQKAVSEVDEAGWPAQ
jgi:hypothetical protein